MHTVFLENDRKSAGSFSFSLSDFFYRSRFHFVGYRRRFRLRRKIGDFSKTISDNRELPFSFSALIATLGWQFREDE